MRYGFNWLKAFAAAHAKPISLPEWGLTIRPDGHGGGDNTNYIRRMHEWIRFNNVLYHAYFEFDDDAGVHRLMGGRFPLGAAEFRRFFGKPATTTTAATPAPTTTPATASIAAAAAGVTGPGRTPRVTITSHRRGGGTVTVAGRVRNATVGRVLLTLRGRHGIRRTRTTTIRRNGRFATRVRRVPAGRFTLVARYRAPAGPTAMAVAHGR
jgi:hypothetical protein